MWTPIETLYDDWYYHKFKYSQECDKLFNTVELNKKDFELMEKAFEIEQKKAFIAGFQTAMQLIR